MTAEPKRLLDDASLAPDDRALLEFGRREPALDYDVAAGAERFQRLMAAHALAVPAGSGLGRALITLGAKPGSWLALLLLLPSAGVVLLAARHARPERAPTLRAVSPQLSAAPVLAPAPIPQEHVSPPAVQQPVTAAPELASRRRSPAARAPARDARAAPSKLATRLELMPPAAADEEPAQVSMPGPGPARDASRAEAVDHTLEEVRALARARALLDRDPATALRQLAQIRQRFSAGYFVEERRALEIIGLIRTGQTAPAREGAGRFLRDYPNGPFSDEVRALTRH